jgi:hypothetical protein
LTLQIMTLPQNRFEHFIIAQQADGRPVELPRSEDEVVFLAFDTVIKRLVELHVLNKGQPMDAAARRSAVERIDEARGLRGQSFVRVIESAEDQGLVFYSANLTDGEPVEDYVARRGSLPAATVFCLMHHYVEDLVAAKRCDRLLSLMKVGTPLVSTREDAFLQLRIVDYGLSGSEAINDELRLRRVVAECGRLLFVLLTGQPYEGQNPDKYPALTCLPGNLRMLLRSALLDPQNVSPILERMRDDIREAHGTLVSGLQARLSKKHIILTESLQPRSHLQDILLSGVPVSELLSGRYELAGSEEVNRYPFSIPAVQVTERLPVTVHLLPPSRVADKNQYEAVPLQMWRFNKDSHPNIIRSYTLWETPDWTFSTEEREPGFTLSRLLAERGTLNPTEVSVVLREVCSALDQAQECGVFRVDIHPSNLFFRVGREYAGQGRESERLMQKRLDAWPAFTLKVRTHATMRSLYEPPLVEAALPGAELGNLATERDFRNRSFVALAIYLLTGARQSSVLTEMGESVPDALTAFLKEMQVAGTKHGATPPPTEVLARFESLMVPTSTEGRGFAAIAAAGEVVHEELESAGSVSDFAEDWAEPAPEAPPHLVSKYSRPALAVRSMPRRKEMSRGAAGMLLWGLGAMALAIIAVLTLFRGSDAQEGPSNPHLERLVTHNVTIVQPTGSQPEPQNTEPKSGVTSPSLIPEEVEGEKSETIKKAILPSREELERLKLESEPLPGPVANARQ